MKNTLVIEIEKESAKERGRMGNGGIVRKGERDGGDVVCHGLVLLSVASCVVCAMKKERMFRLQWLVWLVEKVKLKKKPRNYMRRKEKRE